MNKNHKTTKRALTLGDLVLAETAAAVADLLESGRVRITNNGRCIRARVA